MPQDPGAITFIAGPVEPAPEPKPAPLPSMWSSSSAASEPSPVDAEEAPDDWEDDA